LPYISRLARAPGLRPYTVRTAQGVFVKPMSPYVDEEKCTTCGKCVEVCPVGAVAIEDLAVSLSPRLELSTKVVNVDQHICLWCAACVRACPAKAFVRRPQMIATNERLYNLFPDRKKNETFL
jgi:NAD-dependent dihydropyrimidine dehydrogenase PreA subunit